MFYRIKFVILPVTECRRPNELEEALLCSDIETDSNEPIDSQPLRFVCDFSRDISASDEFVNVDSGLVLLEPNEFSDCLCFVRP